MYRTLDASRIIATTEALGRRIAERFPESGLSRVSAELLAIARESEARLARIVRPNWPIRVAASAGVALVLTVAASGAIALMRVRGEATGAATLLQGLEALVNDVVFIGIAVYFLVTIEGRVKRRAALGALHELRSIAHIIDMHQLTKDPERLLSPQLATASSPRRSMSRFELARYLDYCSELLSITSKLAALHVQYLHDAVVLTAASDVQGLSHALSAKIWQKIMILDALAAREERPA